VNKRFAMKRHSLLMFPRVILAGALFCALPYSHMKWGEAYPGDGQEGFGIIKLFTIIGAGFALGYLAVGSALQFFLRRRAWQRTAISDTASFLLPAGLLA